MHELSELNSQEQIFVKSYSKKDEAFFDKDVRPLLLDMKPGMLNLNENVLAVIDEVSPCRMPGVFVTTAVKQGAGIRPSEIIDVLTATGLNLERPIKVGIELNM